MKFGFYLLVLTVFGVFAGLPLKAQAFGQYQLPVQRATDNLFLSDWQVLGPLQPTKSSGSAIEEKFFADESQLDPDQQMADLGGAHSWIAWPHRESVSLKKNSSELGG